MQTNTKIVVALVPRGCRLSITTAQAVDRLVGINKIDIGYEPSVMGLDKLAQRDELSWVSRQATSD